MTKDELSELLHDAERLAYQTIRFTGLFNELTCEQWDAFSARLGRVTLAYVEALCDEELTRIEEEKQAKETVDAV